MEGPAIFLPYELMTAELTTPQKEAFLSICWMAAHADGERSDSERAEIHRLADALPGGEVRLDLLYTDVVAGLYKTEQASEALGTPELREQAYEMAAGICFADKELNIKERRFLNDLGADLKLNQAAIEKIERNVKTITAPPIPVAIPPTPAVQPPPVAPAVAQASAPPPPNLELPKEPTSIPASKPIPMGQQQPLNPADAEADTMIRNSSILAGALELMPNAVASLAVVPVQIRLVYKIGKLHGIELDQKSVGELVATAGLATSSQLVEGFARRFLGGLTQKIGGSIGGAIGNQVASSSLAFATTYALGQLAKRYYGGGRSLSGLQLKETFSKLVEEAKGLQGRFTGDIQRKAKEVNPSQVGEVAKAS